MGKSNVLELIFRVKNSAAIKGIRAVDARIRDMGSSVMSLQGQIAMLLGGIGVGKVAGEFIETANAFEQLETKLDALTKGKGPETLKEINDWAMKMPVNTQKAVDTFSMMTAMGLNPTIAKMETLVDVSVLFGEEAMPRVARALGQMKTLGKLSAEELNQMSEAGINARKYLTEAFGKTVEELQKSKVSIDEIIAAIFKGLDKDFGGAAKKAQTKWQGMVVAMGSYWTDFKKKVMDNKVFIWLKAQIKAVNDVLGELYSSGEAGDWAREFGEGVVEALESIKSGVKVLIDLINLVRVSWIAVKWAFSVYAELVIGQMKLIVNGTITLLEILRKTSPLYTGLYDKAIDKLKDLQSTLEDVKKTQSETTKQFLNDGAKIAEQIKIFGDLWDRADKKSKKVSEKLLWEKAQRSKLQIAAGYVPTYSAAASGAGGSKTVVPDEVKKYKAEIEKAAKKYNLDPAIIAAVIMTESGGNAGAVGPPIKRLGGVQAKGLMQLIPSTAKMLGVAGKEFDAATNIDAGSKYLAKLIERFGGNVVKALDAYSGGGGRKYLEKFQSHLPEGHALNTAGGRDRSGDASEKLFLQRIKSASARASATVRTELAKLQSLYDKGLVSIGSYFDQRKALLEQQYQAEVQSLEQSKGAAADPAERASISDELFQLDLRHQEELLQLTNQRAQAEEKVADARKRASGIIAEMKAENANLGTRESKFKSEDMQFELEWDRRREQLAEQLEYEEDFERKLDTMHEFYRQKEIARQNLQADQEKRVYVSRLLSAQQVAGGIADAFMSLYELSGKKQKEFFYISKAAALAEAIINVQKGITEAWGMGPILGPAMASLVAIQGGAAIAKIMVQTLATGGVVLGTSPHMRADDKLIAATSGEYMHQVPAVKYYGLSVMEAMNRMLIPRELFSGFAASIPVPVPSGPGYAMGGLIGPDAGGGGKDKGGMSLTQLIVQDPRLVDRYMATPPGQRAVITVIGDNIEEIQELIFKG